MSLIDLINNMGASQLQDVQITLPAKILSFDSEKMRAKVKPLLSRSAPDGTVSALPQILDVPVIGVNAGDYWIKPPYEVGDLVLLSFATHDIRLALKGQSDKYTKKMFSLENSFIIGGYSKDSESMPTIPAGLEGLVISDNTGTTIAQFKTGTGLKVSITSGATWVDLATHTHITPAGPSSPPIPTV